MKEDTAITIKAGGEDELSSLHLSRSQKETRTFNVIFQNVSWAVGRKKNKVTLIDNVTGYFEPCTLTALMGKLSPSPSLPLSLSPSNPALLNARSLTCFLLR